MSAPIYVPPSDQADKAAVRSREMAQVIARLDQLQAEAAVQVSLGGFDSPGSLAALYVFIRDRSGLREGLDAGLLVTKRAIDELAGRRVTDTYGNLLVRSFTDDQAFEFWCSYAQTTGETLALNLKYSSFRIDDILVHSLASTWREVKDELAAPSAVIVIVLVLVVAILILK